MRVLVACERSGVVRSAFRALGHQAWSNDLVPADDGSRFHIQGDAVRAAYAGGWDLIIAHPECTYLANSGAKHLYAGMNKANLDMAKVWLDAATGQHVAVPSRVRELQDAINDSDNDESQSIDNGSNDEEEEE